MECPHCLKTIYVEGRTHFNFNSRAAGIALVYYAGHDGRRHWWLEKIVCPACREFILSVVFSDGTVEDHRRPTPSKFPDEATEQKIPVWPRHTGRPPVPAEVPDEFKRDYHEACLVLADSPNASAALNNSAADVCNLSSRKSLAHQATISTRKFVGLLHRVVSRRPLLICWTCHGRSGTGQHIRHSPTLV